MIFLTGIYTTLAIRTTVQNESQQCLDHPQRPLLSKYMDNLFPLGWKIMDTAKLCRWRGGAAGAIVSKIFCWIGRHKLKPCISNILRTEVGINISWTYFPDSGWEWDLCYGGSVFLDSLWIGNIVWNILYWKYSLGKGNIVSLVTQRNIPFFPQVPLFSPKINLPYPHRRILKKNLNYTV